MKFALVPTLSLLLLPAAASFAQVQKAPSATTLASSSATLKLPGSVTITATVAPQQFPIGRPSGTVQFLNNEKQPLGSVALKTIPATQRFAFPAITANFGKGPYGVFTFSAGSSPYSALGMIDQGKIEPATGLAYPQLSIYSGEGVEIFNNPVIYSLKASGINTSYPGVDAFAIGDFNHDGITDVLIHGYNSSNEANSGNEFYVLPGQTGTAFDLTKGVASDDNSGIYCDCNNPTEVISVDDFNGDGYSDVAYAATFSGSDAFVGIAVNGGAAAPGSFTTFITAPAITPTVTGETFVSSAIATGHFTASGYPDIAVAGSPSTGSAGYVALYLNKGPTAGNISFANPVLFTVGSQPNAIATGDFRANGLTDVVVTNLVRDTQSGSVQVLFGDGTGQLTSSSTVAIAAELASVSVADMNNDGFPDIVAVGANGSLYLLLNDGTGHFKSATNVSGASAFSLSTIGDFNGDGLQDLAELTSNPLNRSTDVSAASVFLNSAASEATLVTPAGSLAAGIDSLTAVYSADNNFYPSVSEPLPIVVVQTPATLTWAIPAAIEYGIPIGPTELDAAPSIPGAVTYSLASGAILKPGSHTVTATFAPTDTFDYTSATASQTITVNAPSLAGISPSSGKLGDASTTVTVQGQGLVKGAVVRWNGTALSTTWVSLNELTAVISSSFLSKTGAGSITVVDPNQITVAGTQTFTITAAPATAKASAPTTVDAGQAGSLTLTVAPYPAPITATLTLDFTPDPPNTVADPTVLFPNNTKTEIIQIPANSAAAIPAIDFSTGSTAGTIAVTIRLVASGVDVTPATLTAPVAVAIPATAPSITSVTIDRTGKSMALTILGLSSTRDMTQATFHFTPATGESLATTDLTVDITQQFTTYYQGTGSDAFGTTFKYLQPFTLTSDADKVGSVTVILTNSIGASEPVTAK